MMIMSVSDQKKKLEISYKKKSTHHFHDLISHEAVSCTR